MSGGAERLNSFSQCEIVKSVQHGNPVLELPYPISDRVITCLKPWAPPLASWQAVIVLRCSF